MGEMIFIFLLALLIFGPRKLPEIAREVGKFMAEFKRAGNEFRHQIESEIQNLDLEDQIKKDAEKREIAMREAEQRRLAAQSQGELFAAPKEDPMPTILPPENTVVNSIATPTSSLPEAKTSSPEQSIEESHPEPQAEPNV